MTHCQSDAANSSHNAGLTLLAYVIYVFYVATG